jgi:hypothetical protein
MFRRYERRRQASFQQQPMTPADILTRQTAEEALVHAGKRLGQLLKMIWPN